MGDHEVLLKKALQLHYRERPEVVTDAMQIIKDYCSKKQTNFEYDEVLKILHGLMSDLPTNILLYFLTTVPLPKEKGNTISTLSELMQKSRVSLLDNMQSVLNEYINNVEPSIVPNDMDNKCLAVNTVESEGEDDECGTPRKKTKMYLSKQISDDGAFPNSSSLKAAHFQNEVKRKASDATKTSMNLLEICLEYIFANLNELRQFYSKKNREVWSIINTNVCSADEQKKCYKYVEDINRKLKWLRMIEAGYVSVDEIKELYGDSEIFLKERNLHNLSDESSFTLPIAVKEAIRNFVSS